MGVDVVRSDAAARTGRSSALRRAREVTAVVTGLLLLTAPSAAQVTPLPRPVVAIDFTIESKAIETLAGSTERLRDVESSLRDTIRSLAERNLPAFQWTIDATRSLPYRLVVQVVDEERSGISAQFLRYRFVGGVGRAPEPFDSLPGHFIALNRSLPGSIDAFREILIGRVEGQIGKQDVVVREIQFDFLRLVPLAEIRPFGPTNVDLSGIVRLESDEAAEGSYLMVMGVFGAGPVPLASLSLLSDLRGGYPPVSGVARFADGCVVRSEAWYDLARFDPLGGREGERLAWDTWRESGDMANRLFLSWGWFVKSDRGFHCP